RAGAERPVTRVAPERHVLFLIVAEADLVKKFANGAATAEDVSRLSTAFSSRWYGPESDSKDIAGGLQKAKQENPTPYSVWFIRVDLPGPNERFQSFLTARHAIRELPASSCQ